jgi:hypothetical protein
MLNSASRSSTDALSRDMNRVNDDIINRRVGADASQSDSIYNFMERRNDVPPDLNQLISLQQGLGRSGPYLGAPGGNSYSPRAVKPIMPPALAGNNINGMGRGNLTLSPQVGPSPFGSIPGLTPQPQQGMYIPLGGAGGDQFASASLPGEMRAPQAGPPVARAPQQANRNIDPGMLRTGDQYALKQASGFGVDGFTRERMINDAQNRAILNGSGSWQPGQPVPLIPGAAGGPVGAGNLLPSLPAGGYSNYFHGPSRGSQHPYSPPNYAAIGAKRQAYMNSPTYQRMVQMRDLNRDYGF